jgi:hypothetical protein
MRALFAALVFAAAPPDGICPNLSRDSDQAEACHNFLYACQEAGASFEACLAGAKLRIRAMAACHGYKPCIKSALGHD